MHTAPPARPARRILSYLLVAASLAVMGWMLFGGSKRAAPPSTGLVLVFQIDEPTPREQRIARVSTLLQKTRPLPSPLLDAHVAEWSYDAEGWIGPPDYVGDLRIQVAPPDVDKWVAQFTPRAAPTTHPPRPHQTWWVPAEHLGELEFYEPTGLSGRTSGWIGVHRRTGLIYLTTSTL